jgi:hypothetical protein
MFKRYILASLVAGFTLGAPLATAGNLWFYPGHGYLPQPPFTPSMDARDGRPATVIAAPSAGQAANPQTNAPSRAVFTAPYNMQGGYFN